MMVALKLFFLSKYMSERDGHHLRIPLNLAEL